MEKLSKQEKDPLQKECNTIYNEMKDKNFFFSKIEQTLPHLNDTRLCLIIYQRQLMRDMTMYIGDMVMSSFQKKIQ